MSYQIKTILVTLTLFWEMGKSHGLKKNEKIQTKSILTFCTVKATEQKRVGYLSLDVNILETVKQSYFNFQGCEFDDLITVRDSSYLTSTSFFVKIDLLSIPYQLLLTFHKIPLHSWCQLFKTNSPSKKKEEQKQKQQHQQ